jgi:flavin reductase (DIM6/NTAB) family NADH-FMN oxidoreductase RutF
MAALSDVFHGQLKTAPMIRQCPINLELKAHDVLIFPSHDITIGELIQTYADVGVRTNGGNASVQKGISTS